MSNSPFSADQSSLTYGRGYVYSLQYHIVWCTKYREPILKAGVDSRLRELLYRIADDYKFTILAMEIMPDHVHLLIDAKPQFHPSDMIKILKGNTARWLFMEMPYLRHRYGRRNLWNPSYCIVTVSDRSLKQVEEYILSQKRK